MYVGRQKRDDGDLPMLDLPSAVVRATFTTPRDTSCNTYSSIKLCSNMFWQFTKSRILLMPRV
jgi:hypothetical protein